MDITAKRCIPTPLMGYRSSVTTQFIQQHPTNGGFTAWCNRLQEKFVMKTLTQLDISKAQEVFIRLFKESQSLHVLLVEDNELLQQINRLCLEELGFQVDVATDGQSALELFDERYDFVLMDIHMPELDGFETTQLIRKKYQHLTTPILAYTSLDPTIVPACLRVGMNGYLQKPYLLEQLQQHLNAVAA